MIGSILDHEHFDPESEEGRAATEHARMNKQCPERCLGIEGHGGFHQTTDYDEVRLDERRKTVERIEAEGVVTWGDDHHRDRFLDWLEP